MPSLEVTLQRTLAADLSCSEQQLGTTICHRTAFFLDCRSGFPCTRRTVARRGLEVLLRFLIFSG